MSWIFIGSGLLLLLLVSLGFYFYESGAAHIADEEMKDIETKSPEELVDELIETEREDMDELKVEESETHGFQ